MRRPIATMLALMLAAPSGAALADPPSPPLPPPFDTPSAAPGRTVVGWPKGETPKARGPFKVSLWADGLDTPRWFLELPNGDVLVAQHKSNGITMLRRREAGRPAATPFLVGGPELPFGMALVGRNLYVAGVNALWRYRYSRGQTSIAASSGEKLLDLPDGGHRTRDLAASAKGDKLYVSVGSGSNIDEDGADAKDPRRAAIIEYDITSAKSRIFASGLRNANGLVWNPTTGALWAAVNERDGLGDDLAPDYVTSVKAGGFYGWPCFYFGRYEDPRKAGQCPGMASKALVPDLGVGAHTASLGLAFYDKTAFPRRYRNGLFIGQHGSWNRSRPSGYRVAFVPFDANGRVAGPAQPFLTGFLADRDPVEAYGRPVGVAVLEDGSLLVADDGAGRVWRVTRSGTDDGAPELGGLMLVDAGRDRPIFPLTDGMSLTFKRLETEKLNLIASEAGPVGSVEFRLDGKRLRVENAPPFTIAPRRTEGRGVDYGAWTPEPGEHTLVVTPFAGANATGRKGDAISVRFSIE